MAKNYTKRADGIYSAYIVVGKNEKGKQARKYVYASTTKELDEKLTSLKVMYHKGIELNNDNATFKEIGDKWYQVLKPTLEYNTQQSTERILRLHVYPTLGYVPIKMLKAYQIQELINTKVKDGLTDTIRKMVNYIKSILNFAMENEFIYKNVASNLKVPKFKSKEKHPLTDFERSVIENTAKTHKCGDMIMIFLYTGIRREELIPLEKSQIKNNFILIDRAIYFKHNQAVLKGTKNGDDRKIPIIDKISEILERRCKEAQTKYLFPMYNGGMMSETSFRESMNSFIKACNQYIDELNKEIEDKNKIKPHIHFTAHQLRHTFCTTLYYSGVKVKKAQEIMGHHSTKMVLDLYTHLDEEQEADVTNLINNYVK